MTTGNGPDNNNGERKLDREEVLGRARRIMAMTNNPNPNEAAVAASKLDELLQEYGVSLMDVRASVEENVRSAKARVGEDTWQYSNNVNNSTSKWKDFLIVILANHFDIHVHSDAHWVRDDGGEYIRNKRGRIYKAPWFVLVGDDTVVRVVRELFEWIVTQLELEAARAWSKSKEEVKERRIRNLNGAGHHIDPLKFRKAFFLGAITTIKGRLRQLKRDRVVKSDTKALVLVNSKAVDSYVAEKYPSLVAGKSSNSGNVDGGAYGAGKRAGGRIDVGVTKVRQTPALPQ